MGFFLFLLVTAALLIRPQEHLPDLRDAHIYELLIILCFAFSLNSVFAQFAMRSLETRPITMAIFAMFLAVVLSNVSHGNFTAARENALEFFKIIVYYLLLVGNVNSAQRLRGFLFWLGACAVVFVTLVVLQYHEVITLPEPEPVGEALVNSKLQSNATEAFVKDFEWDPVSGRMVEFKRLRGTGIFRDPNDICLLLTMGIVIALYGATDLSLGILRLGWLGVAAFFVYALALTYSRGGFASMVASMIVLLFMRFGWRGAMLVGLPMLFVAVVAFGGRLASFSASEGTGQTRIQIWSDVVTAMMSAPLFGIGMNEIGREVGKAAHNSFLSAYAELGLFGGTLFFGCFFFAGLILARLHKYRHVVVDPELRRAVPYLAAMLTAYFVGILSLSRVEAVPTYLILGLVTIGGRLAIAATPALGFRVDLRVLEKLAVASVAFLAASYMIVRVFKV